MNEPEEDEDLEQWFKRQEQAAEVVYLRLSRWRRFWLWVRGRSIKRLFRKAQREAERHPGRMVVIGKGVKFERIK